MSEDEDKDSLQIDKLKQSIDRCKMIDFTKNNGQLIILLGDKKSGKSTSILAISGQKLTAYHDKTSIIIKQKSSNLQQNASISNKDNSSTIYPIIYQIKNKKGSKVNICDLPATISSSLNITQILINKYYLNHIFQYHPSIKIIINFQYNTISILHQFLYNLINILGSPKLYLSSIIFLISKVKYQSTDENVIQEIKNFRNKSKDVKNNQNIGIFLQKLINRQIPLIIIRQPNINQKKISLQNAIDITKQYEYLNQQFFFIISKLTPIKLSILQQKIQLNKNNNNKLKQIIYKTKSIIISSQDKIITSLKQFIQSLFIRIQITQNLEIFKQYLNQINNINQFINKILNIISHQSNYNQQQYIHNFNKLKKLFQSYHFLSKQNNNQYQCINMHHIYNQYIMIKYLLSINQPSTLNINYQTSIQIIIHLFQKIQQLNLKSIINNGNILIHNKLKQFIIIYFHKFINQQPIINQWKKYTQNIFSFYQQNKKIQSNMNTIQYFQKIHDQCKRYNFQSYSIINNIYQLLQTYKIIINKQIQPQFIKKQILHKLINPIIIINQINNINKLQQQINQQILIKQLQYEKSQLIIDNNNNQNKYKQLLNNKQIELKNKQQQVKTLKQNNQKLIKQNQKYKVKCDTCCSIY